ncbi:hypothetical protein [Prosthecomicrobium sp. N25]|uniref:hypothetical protein n=1 Tax=Prosthecomicrobium sp. N25 TaxID=3129254 RepID=UPI003077EED8
MSSEESAAARSTRFRNRLIVSAFALAALVFIIGPFVVVWWGSRDFCPAEVKAKGRSSGTDWEVTRSDCGAPVGVVWQVRIIPTKGVSSLAYEARGGPEPVGYEQKGFAGTITLAEPPKGAAGRTVGIELDPRGRPVAPVKFVEGARVE